MYGVAMLLKLHSGRSSTGRRISRSRVFVERMLPQAPQMPQFMGLRSEASKDIWPKYLRLALNTFTSSGSTRSRHSRWTRVHHWSPPIKALRNLPRPPNSSTPLVDASASHADASARPSAYSAGAQNVAGVAGLWAVQRGWSAGRSSPAWLPSRGAANLHRRKVI